jgi:MFS family permease
MVLALYGGLQNLIGAVYSFPGGWLSDRLGVRQALALFNLVAMAGYLLVILFPVWPVVLGAMFLFLAWSSLSLPATLSLVAEALPPTKRVMGVAVHAIIRRIPLALGPVIGGFLIEFYGVVDGVRYAFGVAFAMGGLSLLFQRAMIAEKKRAYEPLRAQELWQRFDPRLKHLLVSDILIRFAEQVPYTFVVLWCMDRQGVSAPAFGALTAIEMATAMAIYLPVAHFSDRGERKPFVVATFVFFTLFPVVLRYAVTWPLLVLAFVVRGLKEFGEPTRKALIVDLAPPEAKARSVGLYYLIRDTVVAFAPLLGGFLWQFDPVWNLWGAFLFGIAGTAFYAGFGKGTEAGAGQRGRA